MDQMVYRRAVYWGWEKSRFFPVQKHPWGAVFLGQNIQRCACVGALTIHSGLRRAYIFIGNSTRFLPFLLFFFMKATFLLENL